MRYSVTLYFPYTISLRSPPRYPIRVIPTRLFCTMNSLIRRGEFFLCATMNRLSDPSEIRALESKGEFQRPAICSVSVTIGIDRSILLRTAKAASLFDSKKDRQLRCWARPLAARQLSATVTSCLRPAGPLNRPGVQ